MWGIVACPEGVRSQRGLAVNRPLGGWYLEVNSSVKCNRRILYTMSPKEEVCIIDTTGEAGTEKVVLKSRRI